MSLPTRLRQNIRDHIESPESALALKTKALAATLGYPIFFDPEWPMLWDTLKPYYPDQAVFIPKISETVVAWCNAFTAWLESEDNETEVEKLLDLLKNGSRLKLFLEISESTRPTTAWDKTRSGFVVGLNKAAAPYGSTSQAGFASDLVALFEDSPKNETAESEDPDAWADVSIENPVTNMKVNEQGNESLPDISTIARPEELTKCPPYWLIVRQESRTRVVVDGSHGPSMILLEGYLKKWCRGNVNRVERPPLVEIKLQESVFGLGLMHDSLVLEAVRGREMNATLILVFAESVLGYQPLHGSSTGGTWEFKRTRGFK